MHKTLSLNGVWRYESADGQMGEMTIPSNWRLAGLPDYAGAVTFSRTFRLDAPLGDYTLDASVHSAEGELLGENVWTVQVVAGPLPRAHP